MQLPLVPTPTLPCTLLPYEYSFPPFVSTRTVPYWLSECRFISVAPTMSIIPSWTCRVAVNPLPVIATSLPPATGPLFEAMFSIARALVKLGLPAIKTALNKVSNLRLKLLLKIFFIFLLFILSNLDSISLTSIYFFGLNHAVHNAT